MAKVAFLIQIPLIFCGRCNSFFWDTRFKIERLPNFNMFFQLLLTKCFKSELFSCLLKVDHVICYCKRPIDTNGIPNLFWFPTDLLYLLGNWTSKWDSHAFKENLLYAIIYIQARLHMYVVISGALSLGINGED